MASMRATLEKSLGEPIGKVDGKEKKWERVTVGIINSLVKYCEREPDLLSKIDVCLRDELHGSSADGHIKLSAHLKNLSYSYGLSATIMRADGKLILIEGGVGPTVLKISEEEVAGAKLTVIPQYITLPFKHGLIEYPGAIKIGEGKFVYNTPNKKPDVGDVIRTSIEDNPKRNELILDVTETFLNSRKRRGGILVLVKGIEHGQTLAKLAAERGIEMPFLSGSDSTLDRIKYLDLLRSGELKALCATSIFNQGEDIKPLEAVFIACGGKNETIVRQQVGRVTRSYPDKERALVFDISDSALFYLTDHSRERANIITKRYKIAELNFTLHQLETFLG